MDVFKKLKKQRFQHLKEQHSPELFFKIDFNDHGAYLQVVNEQLQEIEYDYRQHLGYVRELLRNIEHIKNQKAFKIEWEKDSENIYLAEYDYLLWQLKHCDNIVDATNQPITFYETETTLLLTIQSPDQKEPSKEGPDKEDQIEEGLSKEGKVTSNIGLQKEGHLIQDIQPLSENYFLAAQHVYPVKPIGNNFNYLKTFETSFQKVELEKFLSLFFSYFQNIELEYEDFNLNIGKESIATQAALFFEKVDEENSLYLKVSQVLPNLEPDFLDDYEVNKLVVINEVEKNIVIRDIAYHSYPLLFKQVGKLIAGRAKKKNVFHQKDNLFVISQETAESFIRHTLHTLLDEFQVFGAEKLKSYKIKAVKPRLNINLVSGIDFLEGDVEVMIEEEKYNLFEMIKQYNTQRYLKLNDGTQAVLNERYIKRLERLFKKQKDGKVKVSFFDLPAIEELIEEKVSGEVFQQSREVFAGFNALARKRFASPKSVNAQLRNYQKQGVKWLKYLFENNLGGCLADDMGLGKTLQTITLLSQIYPKQKTPSLVIMPRTLLFNWASEIEKFNPKLTFYTYYANQRDLDEACKHHLIFTTYATLRNDIKSFKETSFHYIILDESQNIKNVHSQTTKAVMLLEAKHRLALSGTPVENNLTELYSLFRFLNPTMFGSADDFNRYYTYPIQQDNDKEVAQELRQKIYPFILRRLKKDVLKDLPPKVEQVLYVEMGNEQKTLYHQRREHYHKYIKQQIGKEGIENSQFYILQALTELRQLASVPEAKTEQQITSAKRELLIAHVLDAILNGHKLLIFVNFLQAIESISQDLQKANIDFVSMTGATQNRQALVERFQNNKKCKVFLMTLKTGGVGLNLTAADMVYIYDPWWNTSAENQAIDRTYRMGQQKTVFSYKLITKDSIEEKILQLQNQKKELFDSIITSDSASIKSLSEQEIDFILA